MQTNIKKALAVLLTMVMLCTLLPMGMLSVSAEETVVYSADFESDIGNWKASAGTVEVATPPIANPNGGSLSLKHDTGSAYPYLCDNTAFTVEANTDYILTFDAILGNNNGFPVNGIIGGNYWLGEVIAETGAQAAKTSEWTTYTLEFNSGTKTKLYMGLKSVYTTTVVYFDNVKIVKKEVVEPEVPTVGENLVVNGDFENGNSGWAMNSSASVVTGGYSGSAIQLSNPTAWSEAARQDIAVEAFETYTLTWRSKRVSGTGVFNMEIAKAPYDGTKPTVTHVTNYTWMNDTSGNWVDHKVTIKMVDTNGNGISGIMIKLTTEATNPGVILIDDICLTKNLTASFDGYIYNGDFEVGNIDNWTAYNNTAASTAAKYSGNYGAYLKSDGSWGGVMSQGTVNVVAGKTYIVSFYAKVVAKSMGIQIKDGTTSDGSVLSSKSLSATEWTLYSFEVKPSQNGLFINFHGSGGANADATNIGEAYVDDIKVELKGGKPEEKIEYTGSSVRDAEEGVGQVGGTGRGLAFRFTVSAINGSKNFENQYVENSGKVVLGDQQYDLVRMGAVMTNNATVGQNASDFTLDAVDNRKIIDIPAVYLNGINTESLSFAVRILDIPDNHIGTAIANRLHGINHGMIRRGTGRNHRIVGAHQAILHRDEAGSDVDNHAGNEKWTKPRGVSTLGIAHTFVEEGFYSSDARTPDNTATLFIELLEIECSIIDCLLSCHQGKLGKEVVATGLFAVEMVVRIKIFYLASELCLEFCSIKAGDGSSPGYTLLQIRKIGFHIVTEWIDRTDTRDDNSSFCHDTKFIATPGRLQRT